MAAVGRFDLDLAGIDVVIGVGDGLWPGLVAHHLRDEHLLPVISPVLARTLPVSKPADLSRHLLLQVAARADVWYRWFDAQNLPPGITIGGTIVQDLASAFAGESERERMLEALAASP